VRKNIKNEALIFPIIVPKVKTKSNFNTFLILAFISIVGGLFAIFVGFISIIFHAVLKDDVLLSQIGTVLMMISIPMLLVGGHFMDKATEKRK